jgi:pyridoxal phosphate enzyme (YggS family)
MMKDNIDLIEQKIQAACERSGRNRSEITLIAVSKTKPLSMIREAYELGMRHFGENKVQELAQKYDTLKEEYNDLSWHQIGHLQRNKVKYLVDKDVLIHSVDSLRLAEQIEEEAAKKDIVLDVLIEVNIASEDSKFGTSTDDTLPLALEISKLPHVRLRGLMTVAPNNINPEKNRTYFKKMRELYVDIKSKNIDNKGKENKGNNPQNCFDILSMGMTGDFEVAIEEGATMIRIGTGIFGERFYNDQVKE